MGMGSILYEYGKYDRDKWERFRQLLQGYHYWRPLEPHCTAPKGTATFAEQILTSKIADVQLGVGYGDRAYATGGGQKGDTDLMRKKVCE